MTTKVKITEPEEFNKTSLNAFNIPILEINKSNPRVRESNISCSPKIYTNSLNPEKTETDSVSSCINQELTEKENMNYLDANVHNIKSPVCSPRCMNLQNESFPSLTATKLRKVDNGQVQCSEGSISGEDYVKSQPLVQVSSLAQCTKELDEELEMIKDHWKGIFSDIEKFEKSSFRILDDLIEKAENLEKSWKMQKEMLAQRLKNLSKTFEL